MERTGPTRNQEIILTDPNVVGFVERAKYQGYLDAMGGAESKPFFEDVDEMTWEQRVLYDDRTAEDAIRQAYLEGREFGQQFAQ